MSWLVAEDGASLVETVKDDEIEPRIGIGPVLGFAFYLA